MAITQTDSNNQNDEWDTIPSEVLQKRLKQQFGIDTNNRECSCGSTDVTHVRVVNAPTNYDVGYNCSECVYDGIYVENIPVEYACAKLTRRNQNKRGYWTVFDKRDRYGRGINSP